MILQNKPSTLEIVGVQDQNKFRISAESEEAVIEALIDLYKDPIGTTVREIASNVIDAVKEKQQFIKNNPGHELLAFLDPKDEGEISLISGNSLLGIQAAIVFKDRGIGMSEDRVKNVFTVFGASTKNKSNELIGGFGLGAKSPLSYTDTIYVRTIYCGMEHVYVICRNGGSITMNKVFETSAAEFNGTEVIIPFKNAGDIDSFKSRITTQLPFFTGIKCEHIHEPELIYDCEDFSFFKPSLYTDCVITVGNVIYLVDTHHFRNINIFKYPIRLKFGIGELDLVPSREGLRYTEKTISAIQQKVEKIISLLPDLAKEHLVYTDLFIALQDYLSNDHRSFRGFLKHYTKEITEFKGVSLSQIVKILNSNFVIHYYMREQLRTGRKKRNNAKNALSKYAQFVCSKTDYGSLTAFKDAAMFWFDQPFCSDNWHSVAKLAEHYEKFCMIEPDSNAIDSDTTLEHMTLVHDIEQWFTESSMPKFATAQALWQQTADLWETYRQDDLRARKLARTGSIERRNLKIQGKFQAGLLGFHVSSDRITALTKEYAYEALRDYEVYYAFKGERSISEPIAAMNVYTDKQALVLEVLPSQGPKLDTVGAIYIGRFTTERTPLLDRMYTYSLIQDFFDDITFLNTYLFYKINEELYNLATMLSAYGTVYSSQLDPEKEEMKLWIPIAEKHGAGIKDLLNDLNRLKYYVRGIELLEYAFSRQVKYTDKIMTDDEFIKKVKRFLKLHKKEYDETDSQLKLDLA